MKTISVPLRGRDPPRSRGRDRARSPRHRVAEAIHRVRHRLVPGQGLRRPLRAAPRRARRERGAAHHAAASRSPDSAVGSRGPGARLGARRGRGATPALSGERAAAGGWSLGSGARSVLRSVPMERVPSALWIACAALALACPVRADALSAVRERGELVWGGDLQGGEPYVFEDPTDPTKIVGFEVDIAAAIARDLGLGGARFLPGAVVESRSVARTRGRRRRAQRPGRHARAARAAAGSRVRTSSITRSSRSGGGRRIETLDDLRGKRVATLNQTYAFELLQARPVETVLYEGQEEPYFDLQLARVDAVFLDHIIADRYGCPLPGIECLTHDRAGRLRGRHAKRRRRARSGRRRRRRAPDRIRGAPANPRSVAPLGRRARGLSSADGARDEPARSRSVVARSPPAGAVRRGRARDRPALGGGIRDRHAAGHAAGRGADGGGASRAGGSSSPTSSCSAGRRCSYSSTCSTSVSLPF